jgi:hypothetical protein
LLHHLFTWITGILLARNGNTPWSVVDHPKTRLPKRGRRKYHPRQLQLSF